MYDFNRITCNTAVVYTDALGDDFPWLFERKKKTEPIQPFHYRTLHTQSSMSSIILKCVQIHQKDVMRAPSMAVIREASQSWRIAPIIELMTSHTFPKMQNLV